MDEEIKLNPVSIATRVASLPGRISYLRVLTEAWLNSSRHAQQITNILTEAKTVSAQTRGPKPEAPRILTWESPLQ
jgi:hypothetical protein